MRVDVHTHMWAGEGVPMFLRSYADGRGAGSGVDSGA